VNSIVSYLLPAVTGSVPLQTSTNVSSFDAGGNTAPGAAGEPSRKTMLPVPPIRDDDAELIALLKRRAELIAQIAASEAALPNR
jgi:hypothetical protein